MGMYDRIELLVKEKNESVSSLSRKLGLSRSLISQAKSRDAELSDNIVKQISTIFTVSETWLRWGYIENSWDDDLEEQYLTPEKIIYRLENCISTITHNYNIHSEDFYKLIENYITTDEINSFKKRRINIDYPKFVKIANKLNISVSYLLMGKRLDDRIEPFTISIAQQYDSMLKAFICLSDENKQLIDIQISNAFFAQKYHEEKDKNKGVYDGF